MSKIVYYYFHFKCTGESCRLLLAYSGEEFEDRRFLWKEWQEFKPNSLFGSLPMIEIDGKKYAQSLAIARYLGRKCGLVGDTPEDALEIDQSVDLLNDLITKGCEVNYESDENLKETKYADFGKNVFPDLLEKLNSLIVKNNGHLALGKLTWGDFVLAGVVDYLKKILRIPDLMEKYPVFQKVVDTVYSIPKVKAYADATPEREFDI